MLGLINNVTFGHIHRTVCCLCSRWRRALLLFLLLPVSTPRNWLPFMKRGQTRGSLEEKCLLWRWRAHFTGLFIRGVLLWARWGFLLVQMETFQDRLCWFLILKIGVFFASGSNIKVCKLKVSQLRSRTTRVQQWWVLNVTAAVRGKCWCSVFTHNVKLGLLQCQLLDQAGFFTSSGKTGCCCSSRTSTWRHVQLQELRWLKCRISVFNSIS